MQGQRDIYVLIKLLGKGGMGEAWLAQNSRGQQVVIKKLLPDLVDNYTVLARFQREQKIQSMLQHPHIVPIIDTGYDGRVPFSVMLYIDGRSLQERLENGRPLNIEQTAYVVNYIGSALHYAHQRGVLHRDIKPSNILLKADGMAYLIDFGIATEPLTEEQARLTHVDSHAFLGTRFYMAPEVLQGMPATRFSEVYSFGVTVYEMLTATSYTKMLAEYSGMLYQKLPTSLVPVIQKATHPSMQQRYQTIEEFVSAFRVVVQSISVSSRRVELTPVLPPPRQETSRVVMPVVNKVSSAPAMKPVRPHQRSSGVSVFLFLAFVMLGVILILLVSFLQPAQLSTQLLRQPTMPTPNMPLLGSVLLANTQPPTIPLAVSLDFPTAEVATEAPVVQSRLQPTPPYLEAWGQGFVVITTGSAVNVYATFGSDRVVGVANYNTSGELTGQYYYDPQQNRWQWEVLFSNVAGWVWQDELMSPTALTTLPLESWGDGTRLRITRSTYLRIAPETSATGQVISLGTVAIARQFAFSEGRWWWRVTTNNGMSGWIPQTSLQAIQP